MTEKTADSIMNKIHSLSLNLGFALALIIPVTALMSGLGVRFELWHFKTGFGILQYSVYAALLALVLTTLAAASAHIIHQWIMTKRVIYTLVMSMAVATAPYLYLMEFRKIPTIGDVTTDFDIPPSFIDVAHLREGKNSPDYPGEEAVALQRQYFPKLQGLVTGYSQQQLITIAEQVATDMGMVIVSSDPELGRLEATATSVWFGFKDDLVVRILRHSEGNTLLDVRSSSRVGRLDGGVNGKRIQQFITRIKAKLPQ